MTETLHVRKNPNTDVYLKAARMFLRKQVKNKTTIAELLLTKETANIQVFHRYSPEEKYLNWNSE